MTRRQNRAFLVIVLVTGISLLAYLGIKTFNENLLYFLTPTDIINGKVPKKSSFKIGGLVKDGSVKRVNLEVEFIVTDNENDFLVKYTGILPDLFREGQGIIATGKLENNIFMASEILAKHDENYMPPEVAATLKVKK